jgi:hypothetical protein
MTQRVTEGRCHMKRVHIAVGLAVLLLATACSSGPSEADLAEITALEAELATLQSEIAAADTKASELDGGLASDLLSNRLEILRTTEALIQQRIHALESGASITTTITAGEPDLELAETLEGEIEKQEEALEAARADAAANSAGLIGQIQQTTVAYMEQTLVALKSRYLAAKYGLPIARIQVAADASTKDSGSGSGDSSTDVADEIVTPTILRKDFYDGDFQDFVEFDIKFVASGLDKPARSIKGVMHFQDLFGDSQLALTYTIEEPVEPGGEVTVKEIGFDYNEFMNDHQWAKSTDLANMTARYTVESILYRDGTRLDF